MEQPYPQNGGQFLNLFGVPVIKAKQNPKDKKSTEIGRKIDQKSSEKRPQIDRKVSQIVAKKVNSDGRSGLLVYIHL